jgi:hypothetical protein
MHTTALRGGQPTRRCAAPLTPHPPHGQALDAHYAAAAAWAPRFE